MSDFISVSEIPYLPTNKSAERLGAMNKDVLTPTEVDVAIAQDVFHNRMDLQKLEKLLGSSVGVVTDGSSDGDSVSAWAYRLGGPEALVRALQTLSFSRVQEKAVIVEMGKHVIPGNQWLKDIATTDESYHTLLKVAQVAVAKNDEETIEIIKKRLSSLENNLQVNGDNGYFDMLEDTIEQYQFRKKLERGEFGDTTASAEKISRESLYQQISVLEQRFYDDEITPEEFQKERRNTTQTFRSIAQQRVSQLVANKDKDALDEYEKSAIDPMEAGIIEIGRNVLEGKTEVLWEKPIYELEDPIEIQSELYKEIMAANQVPAVEDRAFWLVIKLGQLKDAETLRRVVGMSECRVEVRKEAVRQLLLLHEQSFLQNFAAENNTEPIKFWETIKNVKEGFDDESEKTRQAHYSMARRIKNDIPSFVSAIVS